VPFERFMDWALYHPDHGYYTSGRAAPGRDEGDFTTAPQTSRLFGRCIANLVIAADDALNRPVPFTLVEGGAGEGRLARDVLDALVERAPDLHRRLVYWPEESGPLWRARQQSLLAPHAACIPARAPEAFLGLYLSNELVDAFPVHRVRRIGGELREVYVDRSGDGFSEVLGPVSRPEIAHHLADDGISVAEGCEVEVNLRAMVWIRGVARKLEKGFVATVDYGDEAERLFGPHRPLGTCVAYAGHRLSDDLLADPGFQDLTAHVNFSALRRAGEAEGLESSPLSNQRELLFAFGLVSEVEAMEHLGLSELDLLEARRALAPLLFPGPAMGDAFKVLIQSKGISPFTLVPRDKVR
jgi:SAM-dependent MidA family methyltransferase